MIIPIHIDFIDCCRLTKYRSTIRSHQVPFFGDHVPSFLRPVSFNATDSEAPQRFFTSFFSGWREVRRFFNRVQMDQLLESLNGFLFTGGCNM